MQIAALTVALIACGFDVRTRHIPNLLTFPAAACACVVALQQLGWTGLMTSALGWCVGCALFFPFFVLRGLGAGDVKLAAAIGAWLGPWPAMWMALYSMIAGGVLALVVAVGTGYLRVAVDNVYQLLAHFRVVGFRPHERLTLASATGTRLPYAIPITVGTALVYWLQQ